MRKSLIASALGFGVLLLSSCSSVPTQIEISAKPIKKPDLILPKADVLTFRKVDWHILTEDNFEEKVKKLKKGGRPLVFFSLTDEGYSQLALNLSDLRAFIQQQQIIIAAYESYYKEAVDTIEKANDQVEELNEEVEDLNEEKPSLWERWRSQNEDE